MISIKYHIFVCTACKVKGEPTGFCYKKGGQEVLQKFIQEIDDRGLGSDCLVTYTSCFSMCKDGPCTVIYGSEAPGGVWYGKLDEDAVEEICEQHLEGGTPVEKYRI
jgi:(2Fe-2S) ferredoxin